MHRQEEMLEEILRQIARLRSGEGMMEAGLVDTNGSVHDNQLDFLLNKFAKLPNFNHQETYRLSVILRNRRIRSRHYVSISHSLKSKLQHFVDRNQSSLMVIEGSVADQGALRDTSTELVTVLKDVNVSVLWVLDPAYLGQRQSFTPKELLQCLCLQALKINRLLHNEKSMSLKVSQMQSAKTSQDWLDVLESTLIGLRFVYVVVNTVAQTTNYANIPPQDQVIWYDAFERLIRKLGDRTPNLVLKVVILSLHSRREILVSSGKQMDAIACTRIPREMQLKTRRQQVKQTGSRALKLRRLG